MGTVDIGNPRSLAGDFWLSPASLIESGGKHPLSQKLTLLVEDCGEFSTETPPTCETSDPDIYSGSLAEMVRAQPVGRLVPGEQHRYRFTATFNDSAGNAYQGAHAAASFRWNRSQ